MKTVLISIQPKWCEDIINHKKTIEVRKTRPKIDTQFKCYIYCTKEKTKSDEFWVVEPEVVYYANGCVIGEFVCDKIYTYPAITIYGAKVEEKLRYNAGACMDAEAMFYYSKGKDLYGWHISELKIYDTPKELGEFLKERVNCFDKPCQCCKFYHEEKDGLFDCDNIITRPPQSWCYVEEQECNT